MREHTKKIAPVFETLPILNAEQRDPKTGMAIPSEANVKDAKEWVDENKL
jgi:hypothetical protein